MKRIAFFSFFALSSVFTYSQTDTIDLTPVEVKAIRASSTAPFAKTNLKKGDIEKQNLGQDLPFLLNQVPSVVINSDAGNGIGYTGIRIRGSDATRINVTLNGIPFNDAESQGSFFVDLPDFASSVNSIQVQRGVGTSSNGAGAFGATINLSTNEINKASYLELNNSYGSFNSLKNTIRFGSGLLAKHFTIDGRLSNISSNGYIDRAESKLRSAFLSTAYLREKSNIRFNFILGKEKTYQAWYGVSEADLISNRTVNYAGTEKPGEPYDNEVDNYNQNHYQLFFDHRFSSKLQFNTAFFLTKGKGYYEQYKAEEQYSDYNMPDASEGSQMISTTDLIRQLWLDNDFYGNIFSLQHQSERSNITVGGAITQYDGNHFGKIKWAEKGITGNNKWYDLDAKKKDLNVYGKWQQNLKVLQAYADLQYRRVNYKIDGFRNNPLLFTNNTYNFFNPKIGFSYSKRNWFAYASYSIAHKEPNRDDFEAGVNEQPKPEELHDIEISINRKRSKYNWTVGFYYMRYKDQLILTGKVNDVGAYTRTNIDKSYRMGVELEGGLIITKWLRMAANLTLSENKIKGFTEYIDDYDNGGQMTKFYAKPDISFSPRTVGSANFITKPKEFLEINIISKYVGKQYLDNTQNENRKLSPYYTQDIRIIYSFKKKWIKNVNIIAQVNNLFDSMYEPNGYTFSYYASNQLTTENYYFPMAGINWMLGVNLKL